MRTLRVVALAAVVLLVAGSCGGGEDDGDAAATSGADATATAAADDAAFCESVVAAERAVLAVQGGGDPGVVEDLLVRAEESAPAELEEQLAVVADTVREALDERDESVFEDEAFARNEEEIDVWVAGNCGFERVDVAAVDYAFEGVPKTLPAGTVTFAFSNEGRELHEMLTVRFKDSSATVKDLMKLSDREAQSALDFLGASFGPPGASDVEPKELTPGKYALLCFVPVGSTSEKAARTADGPPHAARGMWVEFTVD